MAGNNTHLAVDDTQTVDLATSILGVLTANVNVDGGLGNLLSVVAGGLRVNAPALSELSDTNVPAPTNGQVLQWDGTEWTAATLGGTESTAVGDTDTVDLTLTGTTITADVIVDAVTPGNALTSGANGLFVPTVTDTDTTYTVSDSDNVDLTLSGANDISAVVIVDSVTANNALVSGPNGLFVPTVVDTDTTYTVDDTDTVDMTLTGTVITSDVIVDAVTPGNALVANANGLFVPAAAAGVDSVVVTTDGTALGVTTAGTAADPTFDILLLSGNGNNLASLGTDGGIFVAPLSSDDLTDVDTTTVAPTAGQVLEFDGTNFVPATPGVDTDTTYTVSDTDTIDLTLSGANDISGVVRLDTVTGGNILSSGPNGLYATATTINSIDDLGDVDTSTAAPLVGQVLEWDGANWTPATVTAGGGGLASVVVTTEGNATGVTTGGTATDPTFDILLVSTDNGNNLAAVGTDGAVYVAPFSIDGLTDVDTTTAAPTAGQVLTFDGTNFVPTTPAADTDTTYTVSDTDTIDLTLSGANDISGVVIIDAVAPANWLTSSANGLLVAPQSIGALTDVDITTVAPTNGQGLTWDGTNFVPADLPSNTSALLHDGDTTPLAGLEDADGNVLANGATVPANTIIHFVLDEDGAIVSQNAVKYEECCVTVERCDPDNGFAKVLVIFPFDNGVPGTATYLNGDLTPFAGVTANLVDCGNPVSGSLDAGQVTPIAGLEDADGNVLPLGGTVPPGQFIHYTLDQAGAISGQTAIKYDECCVTLQRCDPNNGNAQVLILASFSSGVATNTLYLNAADLTPFAGVIGDLVECETIDITARNSAAANAAAIAALGQSGSLDGGENTPVAGLVDADGNALALGDPVPDNQFIHYVLDSAGVVSAQTAINYGDGGCCITIERCDSGNGNAKVLSIFEFDNGVAGPPTYLNAADLTAFAGNVGDLVDCNANVVAAFGDLTDVDLATVAPVAGQIPVFDGTNWVPGDNDEYTTKSWGYDGTVTEATVDNLQPYYVPADGEIRSFSVAVREYTNASPPVLVTTPTHDGGTFEVWVDRGGTLTLLHSSTLAANGSFVNNLALAVPILQTDVLMVNLINTGAVGIPQPRITLGMTQEIA